MWVHSGWRSGSISIGVPNLTYESYAKFDIWPLLWNIIPLRHQKDRLLSMQWKRTAYAFMHNFYKNSNIGGMKIWPFLHSWGLMENDHRPWLTLIGWNLKDVEYLIITEVCKSKRKNLCDPKLTNMRATLVTMSGIENRCSIFAITFTFLSLTVLLTLNFHRNYFHFSKVSLSLFIVRNQVSANLPVVSSLSLFYSNHFHFFALVTFTFHSDHFHSSKL